MKKFIALLEGVVLDINGGEYYETVHEPLFLGIIEAETEEEALIDAKELEKSCYEDYNGAYKLDYPTLTLTEV